MLHPHVHVKHFLGFPVCTERTNTGYDAVILVSDYANPDVDIDREAVVAANVQSGERLRDYLRANGSLETVGEVLRYPVNGVRWVYPAFVGDLREALIDRKVSSIALIGHSDTGSWSASDKRVYWWDVAAWVRDAAHCKDGFGLKDGCNVIREETYDKYQTLSPAYGHSGHAGGLYIMNGREPDSELKALYDLKRGSRVADGIDENPELMRLAPRPRRQNQKEMAQFIAWLDMLAEI